MNRQELEQIFENSGLSFLGVVRLGREPEFERFEAWLEGNHHATMAFLEKNRHLRADPRQLLEGSRQALIFALPYYQGDLLHDARRGAYRVAQYARMTDYHKSMRRRAEAILEHLKISQPSLEGRVTIDSAPLLERSLAARTSSGFIGKNTCYIHPQAGSFLLLGEVLLNADLLEADIPAQVQPSLRTEKGGCGSCRRCQVYCPTGALDKAYQLDARKCLAYWTIEHRGTVPFEFWPWFKLYLFGCDICQLACPYNRSISRTPEQLKTHLENLDLYDVATMSQARYEDLFGGTPLTRAKRAGLRRNALIAMAVAKDLRLQEALDFITSDDPAVLHETAAQVALWKTQDDAKFS